MTLSDKAAAFSIDSLLKTDEKSNDRCLVANLEFRRAYESINAHYLSECYNSTARCTERDRSGDFTKRNAYMGEEKKGYKKATNAMIDNAGSSENIHTDRRNSDAISPTSGFKFMEESHTECRSQSQKGDQIEVTQTISKTKNGVTVSLEEPELWHEFHKHGTEMILNRAGRRMFPCVVASITGLDPTAMYSVKMEICPTDSHRYKFINNKWLPVGKADPELPNRAFEHPDSPGLGTFWMHTKISFAKVKITNNKDNLGKHTVLHSMHKYTPIIMIKKESGCDGDAQTLCFDFEEASFIAVTAYQNEQVTQLKIQNNPFAKAFRDADVTAILQGAYMLTGSPIGAYQALYGSDVFPVNVPIEIDVKEESENQPMKRMKASSYSDTIWYPHDTEPEMTASTPNRGWQRGLHRDTTALLGSSSTRCSDSSFTSLLSTDSGFRDDYRDRYLVDDVKSSYQLGYNPYLPLVRSTSNLPFRSATPSSFSPGSYLLQVPRYSRQMSLSRSTGSVSCSPSTGSARTSAFSAEDLSRLPRTSNKRRASDSMDGRFNLTRCSSDTMGELNTRRRGEESEIPSLRDKNMKAMESNFYLMREELDKHGKHKKDIKIEPMNLTTQI